MTHDDDEMDALLRDAARGYNEPPATPRDEMWTRIAQHRAASSAVSGAATSAAPSGILPLTRRWNAGRLATAAAGIAAVLLLGVLIGRTSMSGVRAPQVASIRTPAVRTPAVNVPEQVAIGESPESIITRPHSPDQRGTSATPVNPGSGQKRPPRGSASTRIEPEQSLDPQTAQRLYQLVALQHFGRTEQLLTAFRADVRRGQIDARISEWARDLLSTTRLLIDSPAADDPQLRVLLGDLEVLLARMAHHTGARGEDTKTIDDALGKGEIMNRLRTAVPAGVAPEVQGE